MAGTVVMIVILVLFPVAVIMTGAVGAALVGWATKADRDREYDGTEHLELSRSNPYGPR